MAARPTKVEVFAYQVGFGDCLLVRFTYPSEQRHVLIDFGSTGLPKGTDTDQMKTIAQDIAQKCNGELTAVVATHRHRDHISGFSTEGGAKSSGAIIRALKPKLVVQPWTEHPDLARNATDLPAALQHSRTKGFAKTLDRMHAVAAIAAAAGERASGVPKDIRDQLSFIGQDNLKNKSAVQNLMTMGPCEYLYHGSATKLSRLLPGVTVTVLGPPTLKQTDTIRKQRARDDDEFWQFHLAASKDAFDPEDDEIDLFPDWPATRGTRLPADVRWFANGVKTASADQLLQLVRVLDNQMNNTSVILLFQIGKKTLLFPGDAQIENWSYALSKPSVQKLLAGVDLYKVGHHGSLNATPKSMWKLFNKRGPKSQKDRLKSVLSTMPHKHGHEESNTEVPRRTLVRALSTESELHRTDQLDRDHLCETVTLEV